MAELTPTDPMDPFSDQARTASSSEEDIADAEENGTIMLGRSVSLTLGTDSLIVLGECGTIYSLESLLPLS